MLEHLTLKGAKIENFKPDIILHKNARVICSEIQEYFSDFYKANPELFIATIT